MAGGLTTLLKFEKLWIFFKYVYTQAMDAKVYCREGNSPDYILRSKKAGKWFKK